LQAKDCTAGLYKVKAIFAMLTDELQLYYAPKREMITGEGVVSLKHIIKCMTNHTNMA
jgi:hypothetical protein